MKQFYTILFSLICISNSFCQSFTDSIKTEVLRRVESNINPGMAIAILHADNTVEYFNFGFSDVENKKSVNEHTIFEIGSITKTFTTFLLEQKSNGVSKNASILTYLPEVNNDRLKEITVADLINHRSGLPRLSEEFSPNDWSNPYANYSKIKLTSELQNVKIDSVRSWSYSNLGYAVLGRILENTTQKNSEELFNPLLKKAGLKETFLTQSSIKKNNGQLARPYTLNVSTSYWDFGAESIYLGAIKSTSSDLIKYLKFQKKNNPVFNSTIDKNSLINTNIDYFGSDKLFFHNGWFILQPNEQTEIVLHNGGTGGFSSFIAFNKQSQTGVVILTNTFRINDDLGLKIIWPEYKLNFPQRTFAFELAQLVKDNQPNKMYDLYLSNKSTKGFEMDVIQIHWLERYCFGQEKYELSNELASIILDEIPDDWEAYDTKGDNLEKLNKLDEAIEYFQKAKSLNPENRVLDEKIFRCQQQ